METGREGGEGLKDGEGGKGGKDGKDRRMERMEGVVQVGFWCYGPVRRASALSKARTTLMSVIVGGGVDVSFLS